LHLLSGDLRKPWLGERFPSSNAIPVLVSGDDVTPHFHELSSQLAVVEQVSLAPAGSTVRSSGKDDPDSSISGSLDSPVDQVEAGFLPVRSSVSGTLLGFVVPVDLDESCHIGSWKKVLLKSTVAIVGPSVPVEAGQTNPLTFRIFKVLAVHGKSEWCTA